MKSSEKGFAIKTDKKVVVSNIFYDLLCSSLFGEMIKFDKHLSDGLVQQMLPPVASMGYDGGLATVSVFS